MVKTSTLTGSIIDLIVDVFSLIFSIIVIYAKSLVNLVIGAKEKSIAGNVVLITGAGHGLGKELAIQLANSGCKIALIDVNIANCKSVEQEISQLQGIARSYLCDVTNQEMVQKVIKNVEKDIGKVDILINNAGITHCRPFHQLTSEQINRTFQVNALSHFWTIQSVLSSMIERGSGHIVGISSIAGLLGTANCVDYCASKFAVVGLMESLEKEIHAGGQNPEIYLTTVCPLIMSTGMFQHPKTRFESIFPICTANYAAKQIIKAIKRGNTLVTVPKTAILFYRIGKIVPTEVANMLQSWFDYGVESHA